MCVSCQNGGKPQAAVWWRVSTESQTDISPQTQIHEAQEMAEGDGYHVPPEHITGCDWYSLSVWDSPAMAELKALVRSGEIHAVYLYDADRAPSKPAHRLLFRALCEDNGVAVRCKYGQVPEGEMGEVMEFLSAWAKEKQVNRAQQGAHDGLRDRALLNGMPVNGSVPYGYRLRYELAKGDKKVPVAFEPDAATYPVAARIWRGILSGQSINKVCKELREDRIPTSRGGMWAPATISGILKNPIYGGRVYSLRHYNRKAKERRSESARKREKTSVGHRTLEESALIDFPVISPVVTWEEWEWAQRKLADNKANSKRNTKRFYLLAGMAYCEHDGRRLYSHTTRSDRSPYYACTLRRGAGRGAPCDLGYVNGPTLEGLVWESVVGLLTDPEVFMAEMQRRYGNVDNTSAQIQESINTLERKLAKLVAMDTDLVNMKLREEIIPEVYERSLALNKAERAHYQEEIERLRRELAAIEQQHTSLEALEKVRDQIADKLTGASPEERQWVLKMLETRVQVGRERVCVSVGLPPVLVDSVNSTRLLRWTTSWPYW
jgi:site-specific DNA recombinase